MAIELHAFTEYLEHLRRRRWFIAGGGLLSLAAMTVVSLSTSPTYTATAVVDAGTIGRERQRDLDRYRDQFNLTDQHAIVDLLGAHKVSRVHLHAAPPLAMIRSYAADGESAAAAAREGARMTVEALNALPHRAPYGPPPAASDAAVMALREHITPLALRVDDERVAARDAAVRAHQRAANVAAELLQGSGKGSTAHLRAMALEVAELTRTGSELTRRQIVLEDWHRELWRAVTNSVPERAVAALDRAGGVDLTSTANVEQAVKELREALADVVAPPEELPRLTVAPDVPQSPAWPNHRMNLLIALVFGLVASAFATLVLEREALPGIVERT